MLKGQDVPETDFLIQEDESGGQQCKQWIAAVTDWPSGESHAITTVTFTTPFNDGTHVFPAGDQVFDYVVKTP